MKLYWNGAAGCGWANAYAQAKKQAGCAMHVCAFVCIVLLACLGQSGVQKSSRQGDTLAEQPKYPAVWHGVRVYKASAHLL